MCIYSNRRPNTLSMLQFNQDVIHVTYITPDVVFEVLNPKLLPNQKEGNQQTSARGVIRIHISPAALWQDSIYFGVFFELTQKRKIPQIFCSFDSFWLQILTERPIKLISIFHTLSWEIIYRNSTQINSIHIIPPWHIFPVVVGLVKRKLIFKINENTFFKMHL